MEDSTLGTMLGMDHIHMDGIRHGVMVMDTAVGMILSTTEACILLGDTADGTHLSITVAGEIHGTTVDTVVITEVDLVMDTATDMEVASMTDIIPA